MNGYYSDTLEDLSEIFEDYELDESDETDESDESDESRGRRGGRGRGSRGFRPPKVPSGKGLYKARPKADYVTQVQLQAAMDRVGGQIKGNGEAIKQVNTRLNTIVSRLDDEAAARKKEAGNIRGDVKRSRETSLLPLLLQKAPTVETKTEKLVLPQANGTAIEREFVTSVSVKQSTDMLMPLILMMGMGDSSKSGDDNNMMLMLAVMMSQQNK